MEAAVKQSESWGAGLRKRKKLIYVHSLDSDGLIRERRSSRSAASTLASSEHQSSRGPFGCRPSHSSLSLPSSCWATSLFNQLCIWGTFPPHRYHANEARSSSAERCLMTTDSFWWSTAADDAAKPPLCKIRLNQRWAKAGAMSPAVSQEIKVFLFHFPWVSHMCGLPDGRRWKAIFSSGSWGTRWCAPRSVNALLLVTLYMVLQHNRVNRLVDPIRCGSLWINASDMAGLGARSSLLLSKTQMTWFPNFVSQRIWKIFKGLASEIHKFYLNFGIWLTKTDIHSFCDL